MKRMPFYNTGNNTERVNKMTATLVKVQAMHPLMAVTYSGVKLRAGMKGSVAKQLESTFKVNVKEQNISV